MAWAGTASTASSSMLHSPASSFSAQASREPSSSWAGTASTAASSVLHSPASSSSVQSSREPSSSWLELLLQLPLQCCIPRPAPPLSNPQESHPPLGWNCFYSCLFSAAFPGQLLPSPILKRAILLLTGTASTAASSVLHSPASSFPLQSSRESSSSWLELLLQLPLQCCIPRPAPSLSNLQESHPPL